MSNQAKGEGDQFLTMFLILIVVVVLGAFIWHMFRGPILEGLRYMRLFELYLIIPFTHSQLDSCRGWLWAIHLDDKNPTNEVIRLTQNCFGNNFLSSLPNNMDYFGLTGTSVTTVESMIAPYFHWPWVLFFLSLTIYVVFFSNRMKFKTKHNLESFIRTQVKMWPVISPIVNFDPIKRSARIAGSKMPDQLPLFAEALSPEEWISWSRISLTNNIPDREATRRAFIKQLGPRWKGLEGTPPYFQALYSTFALKGAQRREESDDLLGRIAVHWSEKGGLAMPSELMSEIKKINNNPEVGGLALDIADQFAYRTTALLGVLRWARWMGGVLAPGQFVWLRAVDRNLWYPLNNLGRRSFHTEGAGAMAHFMAEQNAKKPLPIPRVDTAIITLNSYFATAERTIPAREGNKTRQGN